MAHIHYAAKRGMIEEVRATLEAGQPVDEPLPPRGETALHLAANEGFIDIVDLLLTNGANPNLRTRHLKTPLHEAANAGYLGTVKRLVQGGAELDALDNFKFTPALAAALGNRVEIANYLLESGASPTLQYDGRTVTDWLEIGGLFGLDKFHHDVATDPEVVVDWIRQMMAKASCPEEYAAHHGRLTYIFSLHMYDLPDLEADAWAKRYAEILNTPALLDECEDRFLTGEARIQAQKYRETARKADARRKAREDRLNLMRR